VTGLERRDVVVAGALQRHQLRQYLKASGIEPEVFIDGDWSTFVITASPEQWESINQWIEKTKVEP
jgi:hypothetical protein